MKKKQFHKTPEMIKREFALKRQQKESEERMKELKEKYPEVFEAVEKNIELEDLTGLKVKLDVEAYEKRIEDNELSETFKKWFYENKDNTFEVKGRVNDSVLSPYEFVGVESWMFSHWDLIKVEE